MVALCDKQQQTPILGSPFSALSGLDPQLSFTFSLFSSSLPDFCSFSLTRIQPYRSPESFDKPMGDNSVSQTRLQANGNYYQSSVEIHTASNRAGTL